MNWIGTILFLIVSFIFYNFLGKELVTWSGICNTSRNRIVLGFFGTFFILFFTGFPAQFFHWSWNLYFCSTLIVILVILIFLISKQKKYITSFLLNKNKKSIFFTHIKKVIKENWIIILIIIFLTAFSMANQLPFYAQNYDDTFYIGKIANIIGAPIIGVEDYFNGSPLQDLSVNFNRLLNTYEISYGFCSVLFNIETTFFCRVTMVVHNYILLCLVYKNLAGLVVSGNKTQYTLIIFFLLMISHGFLMYGVSFIHLRSYDLWQSQTAIFYGGSVVRTMSLPVLIYFSIPLIKKIEIKKFLIVAMLSFTFVTFSTIFVTIFIVFMFLILFIKFLYNIISSFNKNWRLCTINVICLILITMIVVFINNNSFLTTSSAFRDAINQYLIYKVEYFDNDILWNFGWLLILLLFILSIKKRNYYFPILVTAIYLFYTCGLFNNFIVIASFNTWFVALRSAAAMQFIILILFGICFVKIVEILVEEKYAIHLLRLSSILFLTFVIIVFNVKYEEILSYNLLGWGVTKEGYDFSRLLNLNTHMTPDIFYEIGNYFNGLPYNTYKVFAPKIIKYDGKDAASKAMYMTTNRIEIQDDGGFKGLSEIECQQLEAFCLGQDVSLDTIERIIKQNQIDYLLILDTNQQLKMNENGFKTVLKNSATDDNVYYLVKVKK